MNEVASTDVIIGVDTHKEVHAAFAINGLGAQLGAMTIPANTKGYRDLEAWAMSLGAVRAIGIEGTGSYGAGLCRFLRGRGYEVLEVNRPNRQLRHKKGKSDTVDAESAARAVLSGQATASPKSGDSVVEMIRHLKVARDTAVKARTQAMQTMKAVIVSAPDALREDLDQIAGKMAFVRRLAALRPGSITTTTASAKASLRAIARRWLALDAEIKAHEAQLETFTAQQAPELVKAHGMATGTAAQMLILVSDNPQRIRSEAAFAKLCGACPIPASSGKTNRGERRLRQSVSVAFILSRHRRQPVARELDHLAAQRLGAARDLPSVRKSARGPCHQHSRGNPQVRGRIAGWLQRIRGLQQRAHRRTTPLRPDRPRELRLISASALFPTAPSSPKIVMASDAKTAAFIVDQGSSAGEVRAKPMFGEYGLYCGDRMVAMVCDDQLFVKPTLGGRAFAADAGEAPPYPGAKPCFLIDPERWDDAAWLGKLFRISAAALPAPKARKKRTG